MTWRRARSPTQRCLAATTAPTTSGWVREPTARCAHARRPLAGAPDRPFHAVVAGDQQPRARPGDRGACARAPTRSARRRPLIREGARSQDDPAGFGDDLLQVGDRRAAWQGPSPTSRHTGERGAAGGTSLSSSRESSPGSHRPRPPRTMQSQGPSEVTGDRAVSSSPYRRRATRRRRRVPERHRHIEAQRDRVLAAR